MRREGREETLIEFEVWSGDRAVTAEDEEADSVVTQAQRPISRRQRLAETRLYRAVLRRLTPEMLSDTRSPASSNRFANIALPAQVLVYFPDNVTKLYQLEQWLPVLDRLHERHPVLLVTRNLASFRALQDQSSLPLVYARRLRDLDQVLDSTSARVCLYVNNSVTNFQVLGWSRALHLHLNHGESDKISMATNQAKAYDYVLVAGPAAVQRYEDNLLGLDSSKLVQVGRPQLDLQFDRVLPVSTRTTVLYAPTWEGETPAMDYSSVGRYGESLVAALLDDGGYRVVYKPHPKIVTGSRAVVEAHQAISAQLAGANEGLAEADRHVIELEQPILSLFASCDVLISDVSSVALDWLYLRTSAPLWLCDPRDDRAALLEASPMASRSYVLDVATAPHAAAAVRASVADDALADARREARHYYFGDLKPGESTSRFLDAVARAIDRCERLLENRKREHHEFELAAGAS